MRYSVPSCPWCGMPSVISPEHHREWETVRMKCGSEIYPPRATSPSVQSEACKRIASLSAELQDARDELATATDALREQLEARRVTEEQGGAIQQMNNVIDDLKRDLATSGPSCARCQSSHCCSVAGSTPPLCVTDPDGSLPLWMPWTNEDVSKRIYAIYAQVDALQAELSRVRRNHLRRMEHDAIDLACGPFRFTERDHVRINRIIDGCRAALANNAKDET